MKVLFLTFSLMVLIACFLPKHELPPYADILLYFNWDHEELLSVKEAVKILEDHNVVLAVVSSVPSDYSLKLKKTGGDTLLSCWQPHGLVKFF